MIATEEALFPTPASEKPVPLAQAYADVRAFTVAWSRMLSPEDQMVQSCAEASPVKWHLAHTTWFFETFLLREFSRSYVPYDEDFLWLFNSYYKTVGAHPEKSLRASFSRPSLEQVLEYRAHVDRAMELLIESLDALAEPRSAEIRDRIVIGLNHEQQHQELVATDIKHALWTNPLHPALRPVPKNFPAEPTVPGWMDYAAGLTEIGHAGDAFAFDNEGPRHRYFLQDFRLRSTLVTCGEYLDFMRDGGYESSALWLSDGWDAVERAGWNAPLYWTQRDGEWHIYTLHGLLPLAELRETPVCHISHFEADAYARWAGARLPSEFEWEHAAAEDEPSGGGFLTLAGVSAGLLHPVVQPSIFGGVWQWTQSAYTPYPGFTPLGGALGEYNGKFMSGQVVLRGGSAVTPAGHMRATYRNFFHAPTRWQFSGIRLAKDGVA